jgi:tRNA dimethylallyltransferase
MLGGEIVGCDAFQVYRGFDAATAKPSPADRARVPHHLVDHVDPRIDYQLGAFVADADRAIAAIVAAGRVPLVVGGTGMYLRGLLRGVVEAPKRDPDLRRRLLRIAAVRGPAALHRMLRRADAPAAARISEGDTHRLVRALELAAAGGPTWSERLAAEGTWASGRERYDALEVVLDLEREALARRLDRRVAAFFEAGLVEEVRELLASGVPPGANAFRAIGYREVLGALLAGTDPSAVVEEVRRNTRRLAKRQRTWFRSEKRAVWLDAAEEEEALVLRIAGMWHARAGE